MSGKRRRRTIPDSLVSGKVAKRLRPREVRSPFEGMSPEQVDAFFAELGKQHQRGYAAALRDLDADLLKADPALLSYAHQPRRAARRDLLPCQQRRTRGQLVAVNPGGLLPGLREGSGGGRSSRSTGTSTRERRSSSGQA